MQIYFDCNEANYELLLLKTSLCKTFFVEMSVLAVRGLGQFERGLLKGHCPDCARASSVFSSKDNRTVLFLHKLGFLCSFRGEYIT